MDNTKRKELKDAYKEKKVIGGIYAIECSGNNRKWIKSTVDMEGSYSRFLFAMQINGSPDPSMNKECLQYGSASFSFKKLVELEKKDTQTSQQFADDIKALYEMYLEQ